MATAHKKGTARFEYTLEGVLTTFLLALPLRELTPVDIQPRFEWWSANESARRIVLIGNGVRDLWATIRMDDEPAALKALLRAGLHDDVVLTYRLSAGGVGYPCKLVETDTGEAEIKPDRDRRAFAEYETRIRLRRVDGGHLDDLLEVA